MTTLLERVGREGAPLIDGDRVTFVWHGGAPAPMLQADFTGWRAQPIALTEMEPEVWTHTMTLPPDAYMEYTYIHRIGDVIETRISSEDAPAALPDPVEERMSDPFNPRVVWNGYDSVNHVLQMPGCTLTDLTVRKPGIAWGKVTKHTLRAGLTMATPTRDLWLYAPPVDEAVPLVVVWDGQDYAGRAHLPAIVDNLIAEKHIRPIALAMLSSYQTARFSEYMANEATIGALPYLVIPYAKQYLNLIDPADEPGAYGVIGASMGGLMALYTGLRLPSIFGHVISQSGAFFEDQPGAPALINQLVRALPPAPLRIWQDVGRYEYLLPHNQAMHQLLNERGYNVRYHEFNGGHNYTMWANSVWRGLEAVYGLEVSS